MKEKLLFAMVMTAILSGCGNGGGNTSDNSHNTKTETPKQVSVSLPPQNSNKQEEYVAATVNHNNELSAAITLDKTLNLVELSQPVAAPILVPAENPLRVKQGEPLIPVVMHQEKPFVQPTIMTQGTPELPVANVAMTPFVLTTKTAQANPELNATRAALTPSLIAHRMNNAITGGGDKYAALAKAKEAVDLLTGPQKQDVNVPVIPLDKVPNLVEFERPVAAPILVPAENPQRVKQGEPLIPVVMHQEKPFVQPTIMTQGTPELPAANVAMTPFVLATKTAQASPELNATRAALTQSQDVRVELNNYMVAKGLINQESTFGATPSLIAHRMNNAITGGGDKYAALAKAKEAVDLLTGPQKQDVNVPVIPLDKVPNLVEFEQPVAAPILVPAENPQRVKQGEPLIPVVMHQEKPFVQPTIMTQGTPELPVANVAMTPFVLATKTAQASPELNATRAALTQSQDVRVELNNYMVAKGLINQESTFGATPSLIAHRMNNAITGGGDKYAALAKAKEAVDLLTGPQKQDVNVPVIPLDKVPNLVEFEQPVAAPILVPAVNPLRVKQGEPLIPVVMHQEKPFVQPTIMTQGTPELPVANVAMTPFVLATKTAQASPELNATRAALTQSQDVRVELNNYMVAKGLINQESTFGATPSLIAHRMNNAITGGGDKYAALAKAKEAVDLLTGPQKQDVNVPVIPLDKVPNLVEFEQPVAAPILVPAENPQRVKQGEPSPILQLESSLPVASLPESQIEPAIKDHGEPELRTYEENYFGYIEVAPEGYNIPPVPDEEAPTYLTPEIIQQQASILESACLTNTQEFVKATGMSLNILGGADFQEIKTDLTTDKERLSYSMEIFSLLQQILAENPDIQEAVARQHAGGSKNSHIKATWTLSMDTGASYSLSTNSSQAYQANIDIVINNQGSIVIYDHNGLELARIVSSTQNGHCNNATYDVVIAEHH